MCRTNAAHTNTMSSEDPVDVVDETPPGKESETSVDLKKGMDDDDQPKMTYREKALANGIKYTVTDVPPLPQAIMLGIQHYLTML